MMTYHFEQLKINVSWIEFLRADIGSIKEIRRKANSYWNQKLLINGIPNTFASVVFKYGANESPSQIELSFEGIEIENDEFVIKFNKCQS